MQGIAEWNLNKSLEFCLLPHVPAGPASLVWYAGMPIYSTGVLAMIMTALLAQKVSSGPLGLKDGDARSSLMNC